MLFLKGFRKNHNLLNKIFIVPILETYKAIKKWAIAVIKSMQLINAIAYNTLEGIAWYQTQN